MNMGQRTSKKIILAGDPHAQEYPEFELVDVLKHRVAEGHPIHVTGQPSKAVMSVIESAAQGIAEETGQPVRIVQHIQLP